MKLLYAHSDDDKFSAACLQTTLKQKNSCLFLCKVSKLATPRPSSPLTKGWGSHCYQVDIINPWCYREMLAFTFKYGRTQQKFSNGNVWLSGLRWDPTAAVRDKDTVRDKDEIWFYFACWRKKCKGVQWSLKLVVCCTCEGCWHPNIHPYQNMSLFWEVTCQRQVRQLSHNNQHSRWTEIAE